jgi:thioredoxin 1
MEIKLTDDNFEAEVLKSDLPVLVDFWAEWCGPCHAIAPVLAELAQEMEGKLNIGKLNVDENSKSPQQFRVNSIPNMKLFKNGQIVEEIVGVVPKEELTSRISKHI